MLKGLSGLTCTGAAFCVVVVSVFVVSALDVTGIGVSLSLEHALMTKRAIASIGRYLFMVFSSGVYTSAFAERVTA